MITKAPPEILSPEDLAYMSTLNLPNVANRAAMTTTNKGLKVHVHINSKNYDIKRPIEESYQRQVGFAPELGKWNFLVKPAN